MSDTILIIGIISSLIFYEITGISPGGIIVPVYIAVYIDNPLKIFMTILSAILTYLFVEFFSNIVIIYGKRKFTVYIVVSLITKIILEKIGFILYENDIFLATSVIGSIIPAIIARDIEKQGYLKTISMMLIVSIFIKAVVEFIFEVRNLW